MPSIITNKLKPIANLPGITTKEIRFLRQNRLTLGYLEEGSNLFVVRGKF